MMVALIDDGIDPGSVPLERLKYDLSISDAGLIENRNPHDRILTDHGTTCAKIILKYSTSVEFCSLRIFHTTELHASCAQLIAAMQWCYEKKIPIVHLSIGSGFPSEHWGLRNIIAQMLHQHQIIVAAASNTDWYSTPASIAGVISVKADPQMSGFEYSVASDTDRIAFRASSKHEIEKGRDISYLTQVANSYAAPTVTAAVNNYLTKHPSSTKSLRQVICGISSNSRTLCFAKPDFISNAHLVNPFKLPILKQYLFFNCIDEVHTLEQIKGLTDTEDIVFIVPYQSAWYNAAFRFLSQNPSSFFGIAYCTRMPCREWTTKEVEFEWQENDNDFFWERRIRGQSSMCPIIRINGNGIIPLQILCKLRERFILDGYECIGFSDFQFCYLYGLDYIPDHVSEFKAIQLTNSYYQPDLMIYYIQHTQTMPEVNTPDYTISVVRQYTITSSMLQRRVKGKSSEIIDTFDDETLNMLYYEIIQQLGGS